MDRTSRRLRAAALCALLLIGAFALAGCTQKAQPEDVSQAVGTSYAVNGDTQTEAVEQAQVITLPPIPLTQAGGTTQKTDETPNTSGTTAAQDRTNTPSASASATTTRAPAVTTKPAATTTTKSAVMTTTKSAATTTTKPAATTTTKPAATSTTKPAATSTTAKPSTASTTAQPTGTLPFVGIDSDQFELPIE